MIILKLFLMRIESLKVKTKNGRSWQIVLNNTQGIINQTLFSIFSFALTLSFLLKKIKALSRINILESPYLQPETRAKQVSRLVSVALNISLKIYRDILVPNPIHITLFKRKSHFKQPILLEKIIRIEPGPCSFRFHSIRI